MWIFELCYGVRAAEKDGAGNVYLVARWIICHVGDGQLSRSVISGVGKLHGHLMRGVQVSAAQKADT